MGDKIRTQLFVPRQTARDPNDRSIVVHAADGTKGCSPGDLAVEGFEQLCSAGLPEPVTLLKLPHHGSRGSRRNGFSTDCSTAGVCLGGADNSYVCRIRPALRLR